MRGKWLLLALSILSCKDDQFPEGLYNYQVERLLSAGDSKTWNLVSLSRGGVNSNPSQCTDSLRLLITSVSDSIHVSRLTPNIDCLTFSTEDLGNANASGDLLFTDSLVFSSGHVWIIHQITSENLSLTTNSQSEIWRSE